MNIVLGVSGGIAAYKAPELVRRLRDVGAEVRVILTENGTRFVSAIALAAVSNQKVIVSQWGDSENGGVDHIELARWAELLLIAPATANTLAKLAHGIADDALTTYALAHRSAVAVAPAMNSFMLQHPTVRANVSALRSRGVFILEPIDGLLACGDQGQGKMLEVPDIVAAVQNLSSTRDLVGLRFLITAGPTREPIDPVRYLTNRSSGKMGYALAGAAASRGAAVTLVSGPTALQVPAGVTLVPVMTAKEMLEVVVSHAASNDVLIKAAAVADFTPQIVAAQKLKKSDEESSLNLQLQKTGDILEAVSAIADPPFIVAFAAETTDLEQNALGKLRKKRADMIVANDVSDPTIGFDVNENEVVVLTREGERHKFPRQSKDKVAHQLLDLVAAAVANGSRKHGS